VPNFPEPFQGIGSWLLDKRIMSPVPGARRRFDDAVGDTAPDHIVRCERVGGAQRSKRCLWAVEHCRAIRASQHLRHGARGQLGTDVHHNESLHEIGAPRREPHPDDPAKGVPHDHHGPQLDSLDDSLNVVDVSVHRVGIRPVA
jgi:hypothetical protein